MYRDCCTRCKQPLYSCSCDRQTIDFLQAQTTADVNAIRKALQPEHKPVSNPETE